MSFTLPNPTDPTNGQPLDATPILENIVALAEAIASFDGSQIQAGSILAAAFNASINPNTLLNETSSPFVKTGTCVWSAVSGLAAGMTSGTIYYNGVRIPVNSVVSHTFTASKDTYVDIDNNANVTYVESNNGAAAGALTANSIRVAKVITSGAAVTSVVQSGVDSLNNQIYPINPQGFNSWKTWVPTLTTLSLGNGTMVARYMETGKTVNGFISIILGSTSTVGSGTITFTAPVAMSSAWTPASTFPQIGIARNTGNGANFPDIPIRAESTTVFDFIVPTSSGSYIGETTFSSTIPSTWIAGTSIAGTFTYEKA